MRPFASLAVLLALCWCGHVAAAQDRSPDPSQDQGNILLVIADDVGVDRIAAYGSSPDAGPTPVIDSLAANGVLFRNAYANPVCSPTRMAILTGRYGFRTGVGTGTAWGEGGAQGEFTPGTRETFLAEALAATQYRAGLVGKWHLVTPEWTPDPFMHPVLAGGFRVHLGSIANLQAGGGGFFHWTKNVATAAGAAQLQVDHYATSENVDDALRLMNRWGDRPWFLCLAFNAPHAPWHVPPPALHTLAVNPQSPDALLYRADLEALDTELGRLLASMPDAVRQRTTIIVVGDNGTPSQVVTPPAPGNHAKGSAYEGGIHVPLIVSGLHVAQPGRQVEELVHVVDLFATVLELAQAPDPGTGIDSISLAPYLVDPAAAAQRRWVFSETFSPNGFGAPVEFEQGLRDGQYKLVRRHFTVQGPSGPHTVDLDEVYDLLADPLETDDLLTPAPAPPAVAAVYAQLSAELSALLATEP